MTNTYFLLESLNRYLASLWEQRLWLSASAVALMCGALAFHLIRSGEAARRLRLALLALGVLTSLAFASHLAWIADDAFISFRYAHRLAEGHGLVFNIGERVEGYTNFLWTLLLAGAMALGLPPAPVSLGVSLLCMVVTIVVASHMAQRLGAESPAPSLPVAGLSLSLSYLFTSYGTSGLETMAGALLALLAVHCVDTRKTLAGGTLGILATMLHPDHAIFYGALGLIVLSQRRVRAIVSYGLPFVVLYAPYFLWRYRYYGELFPNTYYAKSGNLTYYSQGLRYLWINGLASGMVVLLPIVAYGAYRFRRTVVGQYVMIGVPLYLAYVAKIGGDFMLGRLVIPVLPPLLVVVEAALRDLGSRRGPAWALSGVLLVAPIPVNGAVVRHGEKYHHVADERTFYTIKTLNPVQINTPSEDWAALFGEIFSENDLSPTIAIGCIGVIGYKTQLPIVDTFGLTDSTVAHQPILKRQRPGHEKRAHAGYLIERGVDFSDQGLYPPPFSDLARVRLRHEQFHLGSYDRELWSRARTLPGVRVSKFEDWLDRYDPSRPTAAGPACDAWFMEQFYFSHNDDPERLAAMRGRFSAAGLTSELTEKFLLEDSGVAEAWKPTLVFDAGPSAYQTWTATGPAFADGPTEEARLGQDYVAGAQGHFVDSFLEGVGDAPTGELLSPAFTLQGQVLTVLVGGGRHEALLSVELEVGGKVVATVTGCNTEVMGRRAIDISAYRGQSARIRIKDWSTGGWGHILVDEIVQWDTAPEASP